MWWRNSIFLLLIMLALSSCGYQLAANRAPTVLPRGTSLAISEVQNPTLDTSLEYKLRAHLRDEFAARGLVLWDDASRAHAKMSLRILHVLDRAGVKDKDDNTLRYYVEVQMESVIRRREDNALLWQSGIVDVRWPYTDENESSALDQALQLAVRELADRMGQAY